MCRGGKDGKTVRCDVKGAQKVLANLRKKVKYRADKEGLTVEDWKQKNPETLAALEKKSLPCPTIKFQLANEQRKLAEGIPPLISEHIEASKAHIASRLSAEEQLALAGYTGFAAGVTNTVLLEGKITEHTLYDEAPLWRESRIGPCDFSTNEDLVDYLNTMDHVLSERSEEQRILYRGIPIYSGIHEELEECLGKKIHITDTEGLIAGLEAFYTPGKIMEFPTYVSTTHSAFYAAERSQNEVGTKNNYYQKSEIKGIVFEMKTNAGLDVTGVSRNHSYEREVILPRDTRYRIESVSLRPESYNTVSGYDHEKYPEDLDEEDYKTMAVVIQMVEVDKDGNEITHTNPHEPTPLNLLQSAPTT